MQPRGLGDELANAVAEAENNFDSGPITAHQKKTSKLEIWKLLKLLRFFGCGGGI
jgi:hypothetical protein